MLDLHSLKKAVDSLDALLQRALDPEFMAGLDEVTQRGLKAGVIQNFEFTYELCWKFMKRWLEMNLGGVYVDGVSRQELFRLSAEHHLIKDVELWFDFHKARNLTSHTYDEETALEVFQTVAPFLQEAKELLATLEKRND